MTESAPVNVQSIQIELQIQIRSSLNDVWRAMIERMDSWWRPDFRAIDGSSVILEPRVGGRLYECASNGAEGLWYTVVGLNPGKSMDMVGHLLPRYGGPATSFLHLELTEARGGEVTLNINDALVGHLSDDARETIAEGWTLLFNEGLRPFVESKVP